MRCGKFLFLLLFSYGWSIVSEFGEMDYKTNPEYIFLSQSGSEFWYSHISSFSFRNDRQEYAAANPNCFSFQGKCYSHLSMYPYYGNTAFFFGNEVGDPLLQELNGVQASHNRTPFMNLTLSNNRYDENYFFGAFEQSDHFSANHLGHVNRILAHYNLSPLAGDYAWFGENIPSHSSLVAGTSLRGEYWDVGYSYRQGWLWTMDQYGALMPNQFTLNQMMGGWHDYRFLVKWFRNDDFGIEKGKQDIVQKTIYVEDFLFWIIRGDMGVDFEYSSESSVWQAENGVLVFLKHRYYGNSMTLDWRGVKYWGNSSFEIRDTLEWQAYLSGKRPILKVTSLIQNRHQLKAEAQSKGQSNDLNFQHGLEAGVRYTDFDDKLDVSLTQLTWININPIVFQTDSMGQQFGLIRRYGEHKQLKKAFAGQKIIGKFAYSQNKNLDYGIYLSYQKLWVGGKESIEMSMPTWAHSIFGKYLTPSDLLVELSLKYRSSMKQYQWGETLLIPESWEWNIGLKQKFFSEKLDLHLSLLNVVSRDDAQFVNGNADRFRMFAGIGYNF